MAKKNITSIFGSIAGFSLSSIGLAIINLIAIPIITRFFSPDDVGRITLFISYGSLAVELFLLGLGHAFLRLYHEGDEDSQTQLLSSVFFLITLISIIWLILLILFVSQISNWLFGTYDLFLTLGFGLSVVVNMWLIISFYYDRARNKPFMYSLQVILLSFANKLLYVIVAINGGGYKNAIFAIILGQIFTLVLSLFFHRKQFFHRYSFKIIRVYFKSLFSYAFPLWMSNLVFQINNVLPLTLAKIFLDYTSIGIYSMTLNVAGLLVISVTGFTAFWTTFVFANYKTKQNQIQKMFSLAILVITTIAFFMIVFQDIIYKILGNDFSKGKVFLPILLLCNLFSIINDIGSYGIYLSNKTIYNLIAAIISFFVALISSYILIPVGGLIGLAIAVTFSTILLALIRNSIASKFYKIIKSKKIIFMSFLLLIYCGLINIYMINFSAYKMVALFLGFSLYLIMNIDLVKEIIMILASKFQHINRKIV